MFWAWLSSATLRFSRLAEQCHTQKIDLRCFNSDFDAVKSTFDLLIEYIEKTTSKWGWPQIEDDLKNEDYLKNEDNLKNEHNLKNEDDINNEDDLKKEDYIIFLSVCIQFRVAISQYPSI